MTIPCTVAVLTYNSASTLERCLSSVKDFSEIVICDGGSTDMTLEIAKKFNARVIPQDQIHLDSDARIRNFAGVRNQTLEVASESWFLYLDSDEYISEELKEEITEIVNTKKVSVFWTPRQYVLNGDVIKCAATYPNRQVRFFHRDAVTCFIKEIHERIEVQTKQVNILENPIYAPIPQTVAAMKKKWRRYLELEARRRPPLSFRTWVTSAAHECAVAGLFFSRTLRNLVFCRGKRLPLNYEIARLWYQMRLTIDSARSIRGW